MMRKFAAVLIAASLFSAPAFAVENTSTATAPVSQTVKAPAKSVHKAAVHKVKKHRVAKAKVVRHVNHVRHAHHGKRFHKMVKSMPAGATAARASVKSATRSN